jgi:hypothetical protein
MIDLVSLFPAETRLFRANYLPPLPGTLFSFSTELQLLYLRGSVDFYETDPGMNAPRPVGMPRRRAAGRATLASEILALSKQNWNNTQFEGGWPITIRACATGGRHPQARWRRGSRSG